MMKQITAVLITMASALSLAAQEQPYTQQQPYNGHGYAYFGVAGYDQGPTFYQLLNLGAGGDEFLYKGLAAGADIGWVGSRSNLAEGFGVFSPNASYHFVNRSKPGKWAPFVTGGYSRTFPSGVNMVNYGGGVTYWFKPRVGLRMEIRDHRGSYREDEFIVARVGISFR